MGVWAGYLGPGDERTLRDLLGHGARIHAGTGFAVGVRDSPGEPVTLTRAVDGRVTAAVGPEAEAGSTVCVEPGGLSRPTRLTLSCDPFGVHRAYWAEAGEVLWCASDLRLLQRLPVVTPRFDAAALHGYLCLSYVPAPLTWAAGAGVLQAGGRLSVARGERRLERTAAWRESGRSGIDEDAAVEALRDRLRAAVRRRLGGERDIGVFLSGGLDSSLVAALLAEEGARVHLFTLDFGPPFDTELPCARLVAVHLGRPLNVVPAGPVPVRRALEATAAALEQPFGDGVTVPLYLLGRAAAQQVGVVFNGEGGDQLFGGWANKPLVAAELYGGEGFHREAAYLATYHRFHGLTDALYTARARKAVCGVDAGAWVRPALEAPGFRSLLHRLRAANLWLKGAQNIAPRATQLAAAHGLRVRSPFFDRALTEWSFTLPPEWLLRGACEKHLLKRAAEPYLPAEIVWREKRGMGVPASEWCLGPLRRDVGRRLAPHRLRRDGWFEAAAVAALRRGEDHPGEFRRRRVGEKLWALLMLHVWSDVHEVHLLQHRHEV